MLRFPTLQHIGHGLGGLPLQVLHRFFRVKSQVRRDQQVVQAMGKQAEMAVALPDGDEEDTDNEDFEVAE